MNSKHDEIYKWVDGLPISRTKKNLHRAFADAIPLAEILKSYYPKLVDMYNYTPKNSLAQKMVNWERLNRKVLNKIRINLTKFEMQELAGGAAGAIERLLFKVKTKVEKNELTDNSRVPLLVNNFGGSFSLNVEEMKVSADVQNSEETQNLEEMKDFEDVQNSEESLNLEEIQNSQETQNSEETQNPEEIKNPKKLINSETLKVPGEFKTSEELIKAEELKSFETLTSAEGFKNSDTFNSFETFKSYDTLKNSEKLKLFDQFKNIELPKAVAHELFNRMERELEKEELLGSLKDKVDLMENLVKAVDNKIKKLTDQLQLVGKPGEKEIAGQPRFFGNYF